MRYSVVVLGWLAKDLVDSVLYLLVAVASIDEAVVAFLPVTPIPTNHLTRQGLDGLARRFGFEPEHFVDAGLHGVVVEPSRGESLMAVIAVTPRTIDDFTCESVDALTASRRRLRGRCWRSGYFAGGHLVIPVADFGHVSGVLGSGYGGGAFGCGKVAVFDSPVGRDKAITITFLDGTKIRA